MSPRPGRGPGGPGGMPGGRKPKETRATIKRLLGYLGRDKGFVIAALVCVIVFSGATLAGSYLLSPIVDDLTNCANQVMKAAAGERADLIAAGTLRLLRGVLIMLVVYGVGVVANYVQQRIMIGVSQRALIRIRKDLFDHLQEMPVRYFDTNSTGDIMSRFTNDVDTVQEAMNSSFAMIIQSFMQLFGTIVMMMVLSVRLSLIVIVFLVLMFIFIKMNGKQSKKYFNRQQAELGRINGFVQEMMAGQKVEKVFNHEAKDFERFCEMNESLRRESTNALTFAGRMVPTIVTLSYFNYAVSACVGGLMAIKGLLDLGTLSAYLVYVRQSAMPLNQFTQQVNFLLSALSGAERIFEMMDEKPEIDEGTVTLCNAVRTPDGGLKECEERTGLFAWRVPERMTMPDGSLQKRFNVVEDGAVHDAAEATSLVELKGDVRFKEVVFGYTPEKRVLNGISLFAKPGQKIAFVGSTGAGKTTIVNLVNRFYEIQSGTITYDGIDIKDIKKDDLRRSLAMVIQETHLFTGTISDNIRYGNPHATDEEVVEAAKIANADSFIKWLPEGYNTMLYSDGGNLSQGQRQLLAIARAAAAKPPVLILDEATSSVDTRTERLIEKGMDAIMEDRTVFVIAHRLSTVRNSEAIMVLEKGEIIERGNHAELLAQEGRYYRIYM